MSPVPEIAYTSFGRNALVCGLAGHAAAMLVGMTTVAGGELYFTIVYPVFWFVLVLAAFAEWKHRGYEPAGDGRFYGTAIVSVIPVLGPLTLLFRLYRLQKSGQDVPGKRSGFFSALGRLKANVLVLFVVILLLFLLFAVLHMKEDPYFKRRTPPQTAMQDVFAEAGRTGHAVIGKESKYPC